MLLTCKSEIKMAEISKKEYDITLVCIFGEIIL